MKRNSRFDSSHVIAAAALLVALGGSAYAGVERNGVGSKELKRNAVKSKHIKRNQVNSSDIRNGKVRSVDVKDGQIATADVAPGLDGAVLASGSVGSQPVKNGSLTGVDIANGSVGSADVADASLTGLDVANGTLAGADIDEATLGSPLLRNVVIVKQESEFNSGTTRVVDAQCPAGKRLVGGGADIDALDTSEAVPPAGVALIENGPDAINAAPLGDLTQTDRWNARAAEINATASNWEVDVFAICADA